MLKLQVLGDKHVGPYCRVVERCREIRRSIFGSSNAVAVQSKLLYCEHIVRHSKNNVDLPFRGGLLIARRRLGRND